MICTKVLIVLTLVTGLKQASAWYNGPERPIYQNYVPYQFFLSHIVDTFYDGSSTKTEDSCPLGQVKCSQGGECATVCNGKSECLYKRDETACKDQCQVIPTCKKGQMFCPESGECVGICDGKKECAFGVDEKNCRKKCQYRELLCPDGKRCATPCNDHSECPGGEDESFCPMFGKCNSQRITECLCRKSLFVFDSYDECSEKMSRQVLTCIEGRASDIAELNLKPEQVCSSQRDMVECLCDLESITCNFLSEPVAACIN